MAYSMTGFARYETEIGGESAVIEISSVNHRFLDLSFRMPNQWAVLEASLRDAVKDLLSRGKVFVNIRYGRSLGVAPRIRLDSERAHFYIEAARGLMHLMSSTDSLSLDTLISLEGVIVPEEEELDLETIGSPARGSLEDSGGASE